MLTQIHKSDAQRDANKYYRLIFALEKVTNEIRTTEGEVDLDRLLERLLPDIAEALNAQKAFAGLLKEEGEAAKLQLTIVHPERELQGETIAWLERFQHIIDSKKPLILNPLGQDTEIIKGLEIFGATSAILTQLRIEEFTYLIGICNNVDREQGPFLVSDRKIFDNIIDLIAIGTRIGEYRRRELTKLHEISVSISAQLDFEELLNFIVRQFASAFHAKSVKLFLLDQLENMHEVSRIWKVSYEIEFVDEEEYRIPILKHEFSYVEPIWLKEYVDKTIISNGKHEFFIMVPIFEIPEIIGALEIQRHQAESFSRYEQALADFYANQAKIAIRNARLYKDSQEQVKYLDALHDAGKMITEAGLEISDVLQVLLDQAVKVTKSHFGTLHLLTDDQILFTTAWPPDQLPLLKKRFGPISINSKSIVAKAARTNTSQLVPNVSLDDDFLDGNEGQTGSELAVVLQRDGKPIGVLNVENVEKYKLTSQHEKLLNSLANLAVIAINNSQQADALIQANTVALMGAWGADIVHDLNRELGYVRRELLLIRQDSSIPPYIIQRYKTIEDAIGRLELPEFPVDIRDSGRNLTKDDVCVLDEEIINVFSEESFENPRSLNVINKFDLGCGDSTVIMHKLWLKRVIRHFINNAYRSLVIEREEYFIKVSTRVYESKAQLSIEDNGKGVRPEIRSRLFRRPIQHTGERAHEREGRGLLLVKYIVEKHGGNVWLDWTEKGEGAKFAISIPLDSKD